MEKMTILFLENKYLKEVLFRRKKVTSWKKTSEFSLIHFFLCVSSRLSPNKHVLLMVDLLCSI